MACAVSRLRARDRAAIMRAWAKATSARGAARSTKAATAGNARTARRKAPRNRPEGFSGTRRARRRGCGRAGRVRRSRAQGAAVPGAACGVADRGPVPRVACARSLVGRSRRLPSGRKLDQGGRMASFRRRGALLGKPLCARAGRSPRPGCADPGWRSDVHPGLDRIRNRRHLRQNAGVRTTSSVKSSSRPSSMAKLQIQVWVSVRLA